MLNNPMQVINLLKNSQNPMGLLQQAQSANIINTLRPCPIPAYITCSPYESNFYATRGFGYGFGCNGCGNFV